MTRSIPEWIGKNDDAKPPNTCIARLFEAARGRCQKCATKLKGGDYHIDHIIRLKDGEGNNRERNLQVLCESCHRKKTGQENKDQAKANRIKARIYGVPKRGRPMPGTKRSGLKKKMDGTVERRTDNG